MSKRKKGYDTEGCDNVPTMSIQDAYYHLYQVDRHEDETDDEFKSREEARNEFNKSLAKNGVSIQSLLDAGIIKPL